MAADDALDSALIQFKQEQDDKTTLAATASVQQAVTRNPDEIARYNSIARKTGLDPLAMADDPEIKAEAERRVRMAEINLPGMVQTHPRTASALTDADFAALAHDDVGTLQNLENAFVRGLKGTLRGGDANAITESAEIIDTISKLQRGEVAPEKLATTRYGSLFAGAGGTPQALEQRRLWAEDRLAENAVEFARRSLELKDVEPSTEYARFSAAEKLGDVLGAFFEAPATITSEIVAESTGAIAPSIPLIAAGGAGGVRALATATGLTSAGTEYANSLSGILMDMGVNLADSRAVREAMATSKFKEANRQALVKAGVIGAFDAGTAGLAGRMLRPTMAGNIAAQTAVQAAGGAGGEAVGSLASGQEVSLSAVLAEAIGEAPGGVVDVGLLSFRKAMTNQQAREAEKVTQAVDAHAALTEVSKTAAGAKLRERDPARFKEFMQSMVENSDLKEVFIDGTKLRDVLAQSPVEVQQKFAQDMPGVMEQINEAAATEGTVSVPIEDYATHIAGTELDAEILPNLKAEIAGLTYNEAQEQIKGQTAEMTAEAERILSEQEQEQDKEFQADAQKVYDTLLQRVESAGRFTPDANKKYAALQQAYFITRAKKMGVKPSELLSRFNIQVQAERTGGAELEQSLRENLRNMLHNPTQEMIDLDIKLNKLMGGEDETISARVGKAKETSAIAAMIAKGLDNLDPGHTDRAIQAIKKVAGERLAELEQQAPQSTPEVQSSSDYGYRAREKARIATLEDFTPAKIGNLLRKTNWAILTAENPNAQQLSPEENAQRNAELKADLDAMGVQYTELEGKYGGNVENSFAITGITKDQAIELGQKYGQQAVLTRDGFVAQDGTVQPAKAVNVHAEAPSDFYSRIPSTGAVFAVDIDFEKTLPASEDRAGSVTVEAVHFSREPRAVLSGGAYGTGIQGAEARRLTDPNAHPKIKQRISFYVDEGKGVRPEVGVGAFRHELTLTNIYDGAKNPLRLPRDPNAFEAAVIDAGFDGYYIREGFGNQGVGVLLGDASLDVQVDIAPPQTEYAQAMNEVAETLPPVGKLEQQDLADLRKLWTMYAASETAAQYGTAQVKATADTMPGIQRALSDTLEAVTRGMEDVAVRNITHWHEGTARLPTGGFAYEIVNGGSSAAVYLDMSDRSMQIDITGWGPGRGGSGIYKALLDFSQANGFVFYGDAQGISVSGIKRRLENMLSHALQTGDTSYMRLHPKQIAFVEQETGQKIEWTTDSKKNVEQMLNASYNLANIDIPELKNVYFDFTRKQFVARDTGAPADIAGLVAKARRNADAVRREGAPGVATAKRTIFANTLLSASGDNRRRVFAELARFSLEQLPGAERLLYQSRARGEFGVYPEGGADTQGLLATKVKAAKKLKLRTVPHKEGLRFVTATLEKVGERELPEKILTMQDAAEATAYLGRAAVEHFDAIVTDKKGKVLAVVGSFKGAVAQTSVYPSTLVQEIASVEGAANVWASHNHPSGKAELSRSDELLSAQIARLLSYSGSGIAYRGLLAVTGKEYVSTDGDVGTLRKDHAGRRVLAPVAERMLSGEAAEGMALDSPRTAKAVVAELAHEPGILFLSHQYHPVSFAPFEPMEMGELRKGTRLLELFRAAASTGAGAAIIANPDASITSQQYNNLSAALKAIDIPVIDVITQANGVVASEAEGRGLNPPEEFEQEDRGAFNPDTLTISLLKDADLSTFLHETGHFFLETESELASDPNAPQEMRADFQKLLDWFGVPDIATWNAMTLEQKRVHHEKFARGFEAYLLEGKAPSNELRSIFASFKAWLLHVYRTIANLNVELTDEVRGVFDRMLASEDEITAVQERAGMKAALIESTDEGAKKVYADLDTVAADDAADSLQRRSLRDMKWLSNAKSEAMKKLQREAASKRKEVRAEVTAEVEAEPINQARAFLRKGITKDPVTGDSIQATDGFRMNREIIAQMYPETMLARPDISKLRGMTEKDGLHPDLVADMFGFRSGDALIRELIDGENPRDKITGMTDQRMLERYGDLVDANAIEEAANEAVHNDARARFMATGLKMLSNSKLSVSQIQKAAADAAEATITAKKVRDLHPSKYIAAETKANREVLKNAAKDVKAAQRAQRAALLNNRLAKAAQDAQEEVRKGVDRMSRTQKAAAQANMRGEYLAQLNELLSRFDLRKSTTLKEIDAQRTPLGDWLAEEADRLSAVMPDVPVWILNEANRRSYKDLTIEEFRGLSDTVKQLEMMARREEQQYQAIRGMKFREERQAILDRIRTFHPEAFSLDGEPLGMAPKFVKHLGDKVEEIGEKFVGEFLNAETLVNLLEGGEFGQVHESLLGRMSKRADWKATRLGDIYSKMAPLFGQYSVKERYDFARADIGAPIDMSLTRENALVVALLHGNKEGRERLANYGWSEQKQRDIIGLLDERDMRVAEGIWDLFDNDLWPELKALNDRTRGKSPPKVEALEVEHNGKKYRGGYFRLKYDTNLDERAYRLDEGAAVKELLGGGLGMSAKTGQGASTERKQNVSMRPRLDLGVFAEAVTETVHDLAYREAVADTMRLLNDVRVQNTIKTAAGVPTYRALVTRVREIAAPPRNPSGFVEKTLSIARKNTIVTLMSGVNTALQNFTGFVSAIARVNPGRLSREIALFYSPQMKERYDFAMKQSEYMRNRHNAFERDLQNEIKKMTVNANLMPDTGAWLTLMSLVDKGTSVPVWNAAFAEGMVKFENDNSKAVDYADHVVRQTQGSGRELDVAQIMAGHGGYGQLKRVFTMFYSYFNAQLGMLVRSGLINAKAAKTNPAMSVARFTKDFMLIVVLPAVLTEMFFHKKDPDEDPEKWLHKYATATALYGIAMVPLVRDVGSFAWASFDHDVKNYGYKITPIQSAAEGIVKGAVSARDIAIGEGDDRDLKNLIMGTSFSVGLPGKLISDTVMGSKAFLEGEAGPEAVLLGPPRK